MHTALVLGWDTHSIGFFSKKCHHFQEAVPQDSPADEGAAREGSTHVDVCYVSRVLTYFLHACMLQCIPCA
jgi:hypothetical protein